MRVTVCELPDRPEAFEEAWGGLAAHVRAERSELVLLPELPFAPWFATRREFEPATWRAVVERHEAFSARLAELAPAAVFSTRPIEPPEGRFNEGYAWDAAGGLRAVHRKRYLPDEPAYWEASWYRRGATALPPVVPCGGAAVSFRICSELWFLAEARALGKQGVHLLLAPRATPASGSDRWIAAGRVAAVVAGAFCLSSNRTGPSARSPGLVFAGNGWIVSPEGEVTALTTSGEPFVTRDLDLAQAERAKSTYPRYVAD
jgi:N-carbamoylputrescine amidase